MRKAYLPIALLAYMAAQVALPAYSAPTPPAGWLVNGSRLECTYKLGNFVESVAWVQKLVMPAEALGHHPDVVIAYDRVSLSLTTHDAGGLTELDWKLAREIDTIATHQDPPLHCQPQP